jgi:hypothetical protein
MIPRGIGPGGAASLVRYTSWFGTQESSRVWFNTRDCIGLVFFGVVWGFLLFAFSTVLLMYLDMTSHAEGKRLISNRDFIVICSFFFLVCWAHLASSCGDPGSVPWNAHPTSLDRKSGLKLTICGHCDSYKPPGSHHDRVSGRCVSRMDHFCPWLNNAVGAGNQKNFILFLVYTCAASSYLYSVIVLHLMRKDIIYPQPLLNMTRCLLFVLVFAIVFSVSMIFNQIYGIKTGFGTIDRMKMSSAGLATSQLSPVPLSHVFGDIGLSWLLPLSPIYPSPEDVYRYRTRNYRYGKAV